MLYRISTLGTLALLCRTQPAPQQAAESTAASPSHLLTDPASLEDPMALPVLPGRTSSVFTAEAGAWQFNLHSYLTHFEGKFWAIWSSGRIDEDSSSQVIRYASSPDGHQWSESGILAQDPDGPDQPGFWIARGVFVLNDKLTALCARIGGSSNYRMEHKGVVWPDLILVRFEWDGKGWVDKGAFLENCMNNFPPRPLGSGLFMTCRDSRAIMHTACSETLSGESWTVEALPAVYPGDRMSEPSWYVDLEGTVHLLLRDQRKSRYLFQSISKDNGRSWTAPVQTDYPDATSKNFSGRLSTGEFYLINNPNQQGRDPLAISFSDDGWVFSQPRAIRKEAPARRFPGRAKNDRSFQYPHAIEQNGSLWVIYSTNKEDIQVSEFALEDLPAPGGEAK